MIISSMVHFELTDVVRTYVIIWLNVKKITTKSIFTEMWSSDANFYLIMPEAEMKTP